MPYSFPDLVLKYEINQYLLSRKDSNSKHYLESTIYVKIAKHYQRKLEEIQEIIRKHDGGISTGIKAHMERCRVKGLFFLRKSGTSQAEREFVRLKL